MINVAFIRHNGRMKPRGFVADLPFGITLPYSKPFIVVQVDETTVPDGVVGNPTVELKLDELMLKYPSTTEKYTDEDGVEQERIIHGYFHEDGNSSTPYPVITMEDVDYE